MLSLPSHLGSVSKVPHQAPEPSGQEAKNCIVCQQVPQKNGEDRWWKRLLAPWTRWTSILMLGLSTGLYREGLAVLGAKLFAAFVPDKRLSSSADVSASRSLVAEAPPYEPLHLTMAVAAASFFALGFRTVGGGSLTDLSVFGKHHIRATFMEGLWGLCQSLGTRQAGIKATPQAAAHEHQLEARGQGLADDLALCIIESPERNIDESAWASTSRDCGGEVGSGCSMGRNSAAAEEGLINVADLKLLLRHLDGVQGGMAEECGWTHVMEKESSSVQYTAYRRDPENGGPTEYLSCTTFENCTPDLLRDFYMDSEFLVEWDATARAYRRLHVCDRTGVETGYFVKKYPFCAPREYVLAWRLWRDGLGTHYCITKGVEHPEAPRLHSPKRVDHYHSSWQIQKVPGRHATRIVMRFSEDIGMQRDMAKMVFRRSVWGYIKNTDAQLRVFAARKPQPPAGSSAVSLAQPVPWNLLRASQQVRPSDIGSEGAEAGPESKWQRTIGPHPRCAPEGAAPPAPASETRIGAPPAGSHQFDLGALGHSNVRWMRRPIARRGIRKRVATACLVIGGAVFMTHGAVPVAARLAIACVINSLVNKRKASAAGL